MNIHILIVIREESRILPGYLVRYGYQWWVFRWIVHRGREMTTEDALLPLLFVDDADADSTAGLGAMGVED